mgnify:CR=1 FL=1
MYGARISVSNPGLVVILIDRSSSMDEEVAKIGKKKLNKDFMTKVVADKFLYDLLAYVRYDVLIVRYNLQYLEYRH